jgi:hypothetical protein
MPSETSFAGAPSSQGTPQLASTYLPLNDPAPGYDPNCASWEIGLITDFWDVEYGLS